jgi:hypothetical protein
MRRYLLLLLVLGSSLGLSAQIYYDDARQICCGDSLLNGSYQALGINPAFLGQTIRTSASFGILQVGGNLYSEGLDKSELFELSFTDNFLSDSAKQALLATQEESDYFRHNANLNISWLAFSYTHPKIGGLAINVQDRWRSSSTIRNDFIGLLLRGTESQVYQQANSLDELVNVADGSDVYYQHLREVRVGYGRKLFALDEFTFYGGLTYKWLWGIGYFDAGVNEGNYAGSSAFSDLYRINYGQLNLQDPSMQRQLLDHAGTGSAFDLGLSVSFGKKLELAAAVIDWGGLNWEKEIVESRAPFGDIVDSIQSGLIDSYDFAEELGGLYNVVQAQPGASFRQNLQTRARFNALWRITKGLNVNANLILPLDQNRPTDLNVEKATAAAAITWAPIPKLLRLSTGVFYNGRYGTRLPLGVSFGWGRNGMISLSTTDILTWVTGRSPFPSLSVGTVSLGF